MATPRLIKADLHSHTHFSRDGLTTPEEFSRRNARAGIDCVAVSDHNNIEGALAVQRIAPFRVILAEEIRSTEGEIIGYFLRDPVPKRLTPEETVRAIQEQGGLVGVPHPFDRARSSPLRRSALLRILPNVQILETFNARNIFQADNHRAAAFAARHGLAPSAGTDAHWGPEVGRTYVVMPSFEGRDDFLECLRQGRIAGHAANPLVHLMSSLARLRWRLGLSPVETQATRP